jgi:parallel beta-helix repeat protein
MYNAHGNLTVTNSTFNFNSSDAGGGMRNYYSSPIVTNCTFTGNSAVFDGGVMHNSSSNPTVTNCTFTGNSADRYGAGITIEDNSSLTVTNCILWDNTASNGNEFALKTSSSTINVDYCDIQGGQADIYNYDSGTVNWGIGNIDKDPLFVDTSNPDPNLWNLRLQLTSPCIDVADNNASGLTAVDLDGNRRLFDGDADDNEVVDMGAYEFASIDLIAHFKLDESAGDTALDSFGNNHGTLEPDSPLWRPEDGRFSGALQFDGIDDYVLIPNESEFDITYQITVSAWIKIAAFDRDWQAIVTKGDSAWRLHRFNDSNSLSFHCNSFWGPAGSVNVNDGRWHHAVGVYDGARASLYIDGVLDNSVLASGPVWTNDYPVMIGDNAEEPGRYFNGLIDDARIYTRALTPAQVYQLYTNGLYVDADAVGSNDGSSWADAFNYLQDALDQPIVTGNEIRVAEGIYTPDADTSDPCGTGDRTASFELINAVSLKGGYAGFGQLDPNARDIDSYLTVLSGDIGIDANSVDNSYHVVTSSLCNIYTLLDGFTITGGNANGFDPNNNGGGMFNLSSSPTVTNCTFIVNSAFNYGGGMYNTSSSSPDVTNCTFTENSAFNYGGGMYNTSSSSPIVINCTFTGNSANNGGGMCNWTNTSPAVTNCTFTENSANNGGGMYNTSSSSFTVTNCTFTGNSAFGYGGGLYNNISSPTVTNCTFTENSAIYGGGMFNILSSGSPIVTNSVLWNNTPDQIGNISSIPAVTFSDIQDGTGQPWFGEGCIDADPCFVDTSSPDPNLWNLRLAFDSPCIDAGDPCYFDPIYPTDLDGRDRLVDGDCNDTLIVDMGAYEFTSAYYGDFDGDCDVEFIDYAIFAGCYLTDEPSVDIAPTPAGDGIVDPNELVILCNYWLWGK